MCLLAFPTSFKTFSAPILVKGKKMLFLGMKVNFLPKDSVIHENCLLEKYFNQFESKMHSKPILLTNLFLIKTL